MQRLQNAFTRRFNTRHRLWGRLFGDRYKAVLVEASRILLRDAAGLHSPQSGTLRAGAAAAPAEFARLPLEQRRPGYALLPGADRTGWRCRMDWRPSVVPIRPKGGGVLWNGWTDAWWRRARRVAGTSH